jgi:5-methylcytosine-specific restriction endonuclease McrA
MKQYIFNLPYRKKKNLTPEDYKLTDVHGRNPYNWNSVTHEKIIKFWRQHPLKHMLNFKIDELRVTPLYTDKSGIGCGCMACGILDSTLDRAHILPKAAKGSNYENNLHILCKACHAESEHKWGINYWLWIGIKSKLFKFGSDLTTERDYLGGGPHKGELYDYPYEAEYINKLKTYHKEYAILSFLKKWEYHYMQAEQILNNEHNLKIKFGDVSTISLIDEYIVREKPMKLKELKAMVEGQDMVEQTITIQKTLDPTYTEEDEKEFRKRMEEVMTI